VKESSARDVARWSEHTGLSPANKLLAEATGAPSKAVAGDHSPWWVFAFVLTELAAQISLLFDAVAPARVVIRIAAFVGSLGLLFLLQSKSSSMHPSWRLALVVLFILGLSIFHPETSSAWAGLAAIFLHAAIFGPIFWVPRLRIDVKTVRRLFLLFWAFNTASAFFGALQVYYPGRFQPAVSRFLVDSGAVQGLEISLADGTRVLRPMGLSDSPGGAAVAGMYCVLLGTAFLLDVRRSWERILSLASMGLGLFALYLCQVRVLVVMVGVSVLSMAIPFAARRRLGDFWTIAGAVAAVAVVGFVMAVSVGGEAVTNRFSTLLEGDPASVYYSNRGFFVQHTITELVPQYPVGAGLGRWGMVASYFGETAKHSLWAEVQWTAWLYDGGLLMMVAYPLAIAVALRTALRIATENDGINGELQKWASVLFGYGVGVFATTFSACTFEGTFGIDFWILNATIFAASAQLKPTR
jgi:hypothetical protein